MELSEHAYQLIHKFLSNQLGDNEKDEFRVLLENDAFRKELELQAQLIDALSEVEDQKVIELINGGDQSSQKTKKPVRSLFPLMMMAASVLLVFGLWFGFKDQFISQDIGLVLAEHSSAFPPDQLERGGGSKMEERYKEAMVHYANQNYDLANNLFLDIKPQTDKILLFRANCLIELQKFKEASVLLSKLLDSSDYNTRYNAEWYHMIALLYQGDKQNGLKALDDIAIEKTHLFYLKAKELKKDL